MRVSVIVLFILFLMMGLTTERASAQMRDYNTMVGVVGGTNLGGTVKQFISQPGAVDLLVYRRWKGTVAALLYEHHFNITEFRGLEWFAGGGAHYGVWKDGKGEPPWVYRIDQDYKPFGVDAIVGLEYNFHLSNFYLGLYWKPAYNFQDFTDFWGDEAAFTLRYAL
ncbi:hypothetical protein LZF95_19695 [Algoriphagus sp. AGSA1]|uniref:hypothetical protein n=1 Tax=Algoriphagus sp. AGSA1 TaxID=2907213 RepID=UPI001F28856C|nr:hypothetical protein [Algoriphagus sp. AGSA1]MCE7056913.1 hypothetical protein [Algoriphagus sp. AGSA1]